MKTILVAGGAGYIGSHVVRALQEAGYDLVVYDNLSRGHRQAVPDGIPFVQGDIGDVETLGRTLRNFGVEAALHFAADSQVGESVSNPQRYFENNVGQGLTFLRTLLENGVKALVFSSTAAVYGEPESAPGRSGQPYLTEDHPLRPSNPYGESKAFFETVLKRYAAAYGLRSISLRYFNAAGAHASGDIGEDHNPESHLIPLVLKVALGQREKITVYGDDYPTPDGTPIRDYIHVEDLAWAHVLALRKLEKAASKAGGVRKLEEVASKAGGEKGTGRSAGVLASSGGPSADHRDLLYAAYNLSNGQGYSVLEVIEAARRVTGQPIPLERGPRRPGDPAILVASSERARHDLGWEPKHPTLEEIIASAWEWHRRHPHGYGG